MTARNDWVAHLVKYSIPELRRRQRIIDKWLLDYYCRGGSLQARGLQELEDMQDSLIEAIKIKNGYITGEKKCKQTTKEN